MRLSTMFYIGRNYKEPEIDTNLTCLRIDQQVEIRLNFPSISIPDCGKPALSSYAGCSEHIRPIAREEDMPELL